MRYGQREQLSKKWSHAEEKKRTTGSEKDESLLKSLCQGREYPLLYLIEMCPEIIDQWVHNYLSGEAVPTIYHIYFELMLTDACECSWFGKNE